MKKIFKELKRLQKLGYYYRLVACPETIDIKLYMDKSLTSPETNFLSKNTEDGLYEIFFNLQKTL